MARLANGKQVRMGEISPLQDQYLGYRSRDVQLPKAKGTRLKSDKWVTSYCFVEYRNKDLKNWQSKWQIQVLKILRIPTLQLFFKISLETFSMTTGVKVYFKRGRFLKGISLILNWF